MTETFMLVSKKDRWFHSPGPLEYGMANVFFFIFNFIHSQKLAILLLKAMVHILHNSPVVYVPFGRRFLTTSSSPLFLDVYFVSR